MLTLIYIWALLSAPYDRMLCSMWVSQAPSPAVMKSAGCVWTPEQAQAFVWRAVDLHTGQTVCQRPASELPTLTCDIWPLDHYLIRVYEPAHVDQYCVVSIVGPPDGIVGATGPVARTPTAEEIKTQCPLGALEALQSGKATWKLVSSGPATDPQEAPEICPLPPLAPADLPKSIATANNYFLLDYELYWWYGNDYDSNWQNQYDTAILQAGAAESVPPRLIKGVFAQESQFWPTWTPERRQADEVGLGQLTDDGADLVLRYSPELYEGLCPIASWDCSQIYDRQPVKTRTMLRDILRGRLIVTGTPRQAAAQAAATIPTWARILKAYYCAAGEIVRPAGLSPSWDYALAAYHSGPECVRGGNICEDGKKYIEEVKR
jgi:hypothetical protein